MLLIGLSGFLCAKVVKSPGKCKKNYPIFLWIKEKREGMDFNIEAHPLIRIIKVSIRVDISFLGM